MAEANLVNGDLLPILASWSETETNDKLKSRVALACLEIFVPLTWPIETDGEMTVNHHRHTPYLQQAQVYYKAGILGVDNCHILRQAVRIGIPAIATAREDRSARDEAIIKLVLYFLRNIATIDSLPNLPGQGLENEVSRSTTIEVFRQQDVFALLLTICSNMGEDFNLQDVIVLEIFFNLIKGVDVEKLWMAEVERKGEELSELTYALNVEKGWQRDFKKNGPLGWSRHGRFGTMIWVKREDEKMSAVSGQDNLKDSRHTLFNMDRTKKWNKPQQKSKSLNHTIHEFDKSTRVTTPATALLRNFVEEFLDSGFNPLFNHLRKAIEREAERLLDVNYRQFFYCVSWCLQAERVRRRKLKHDARRDPKLAENFEAESYATVACVLNQETFILLNRYMQQTYDNKEWQDLNAAIRCFTQILLTVQEMATSSIEEDQEIAENIQNRIFYEETTHDRIVSILRGYKDQGFGYLDACTELSHVFLRMLERYSKENVDLQVRSRRRARKRKTDAKASTTQQDQQPPTSNSNENLNNDSDSDREEEISAAATVSRERKFDFNRFSAKFTTQASVNTFVSLTTYYLDLNPTQLKRAHRFFHQCAFKQDLAVLLYRLDIVALFYKMIKGPEGLDTANPMYGEWSELIRQLLKKMFRKLEARPELLVEMLFSKISATMYYLEFGQEKQTVSETRVPVEVEVRDGGAGREVREQIGIVVTALCREGKREWVKWLADELKKAAAERKGWEDSVTALAARSEGEAASPRSATPIKVEASGSDLRKAVFKNARLRLLIRLVDIKRSEPDVFAAPLIIPATLTSAHLEQSSTTITHFEQEPWKGIDEAETAESLIKRVRANDGDPQQDKYEEDGFIVRGGAMFSDESSDDGNDAEEFLFPDNLPTKRKLIAPKPRKRKRDSDDDDEEATELDDATLAARRKARKQAALDRRRKIKSELRIQDSDDETDDERDKDFFRQEEIRRREQNQRVQEAMRVGSKADKEGKRKSKKAKSVIEVDSDDDMDVNNDVPATQEAEDTATASSQVRQDVDDSAPEDDDSSQSSILSSPIQGPGKILQELSQPQVPSFRLSSSKTLDLEGGNALSNDEDEEDPIAAGPVRQRARAGLVFDSDDE